MVQTPEKTRPRLFLIDGYAPQGLGRSTLRQQRHLPPQHRSRKADKKLVAAREQIEHRSRGRHRKSDPNFGQFGRKVSFR